LKALNGLFCADVPLRNYSLTHSLIVIGVYCSLHRTYTGSCMLVVCPMFKCYWASRVVWWWHCLTDCINTDCQSWV